MEDEANVMLFMIDHSNPLSVQTQVPYKRSSFMYTTKRNQGLYHFSNFWKANQREGLINITKWQCRWHTNIRV